MGFPSAFAGVSPTYGSGRAKVYGHRGARGERPENTIEGFLHARAVGVAGIETDIAMTADLVPVLHHDPQLGDGRLIRDLALCELSGIPTLAEVFGAVPEMDWLLEIKTFPPSPEKSHSPAVVVETVVGVIAAAKIPSSRLRILAFDWAVLREVERRAPEIRRVCLTEPGTEAARDLWWGPGLSAASTAQAVAASGADAWAGFHETLTAQNIGEARGLGLGVFAWTVNRAEDFRRLAPLVDGVITDFPGRFIAGGAGFHL